MDLLPFIICKEKTHLYIFCNILSRRYYWPLTTSVYSIMKPLSFLYYNCLKKACVPFTVGVRKHINIIVSVN